MEVYARTFEASTENPTVSSLAPYVLYETLGPTLPQGLRDAAALWGLAHRCAMTYPAAVRQAGHADGNALFEAILNSPSGVVFTRDEYGEDFARIIHPDRRIALELPDMLGELRAIDAGPAIHTTEQFPIVLSVGERRSFTANDIFRELAQTGHRWAPANKRRRRSPDWPRGRRGGGDQHGPRQRSSRRGDKRLDAGRARLTPERLRAREHRCRRRADRYSGRTQLAHVLRVAR
jgi:hypothetical protein